MDLVKYCQEWFERMARDRRDLLEDKWNRNRAAYECNTDVFDSYVGAWKNYQDQTPDRPATEAEFHDTRGEGNSPRWRSKTFLPIAKQKTVALKNLVNDQVFKGNKIPFQCDIYPGLYATPAQFSDLNDRRQKIENKLVEMLQRTKAVRGFKKVVNSACIYGEGYLRKVTERVEQRRLDDQGQMQINYEEYLSAKSVSVWDIFRDLQFDDLDDGVGICQRIFVSVADMKMMMEDGGEESYWFPDRLKPAVDSIGRERVRLLNSPDDSINPRLRDLDELSANYEYREFWVRVPLNLAVALEKTLDYSVESDSSTTDELDEDFDHIYVLCGILGDTVIRYSRTSKGGHPFYRYEMESDPDGVGGISVIDNIINEQKVLNGMIRSYEDNKKLSSNLIFASDDGAFVGDFKDWYPGVDLKLKGRKDIREAIQQLVVTDVGEGLMNGIQMFTQFADMSSNVPREQQGMSSDNPQTAFEIQQRLERSGKYVGQVVSNLDEDVIEPFMNDCYDWLASDPDFDDLGMAFKVNALGFASYEARALRQQSLMQLYTLMVQNPEWLKKVSADYFLSEIAKSVGIPPTQFVLTDEEVSAREESAKNDPMYQLEMQARQLEVEKIKAEISKLLAEAGSKKADTDKTNVDSKTKLSENLTRSPTVDPDLNSLASDILTNDIG